MVPRRWTWQWRRAGWTRGGHGRSAGMRYISRRFQPATTAPTCSTRLATLTMHTHAHYLRCLRTRHAPHRAAPVAPLPGSCARGRTPDQNLLPARGTGSCRHTRAAQLPCAWDPTDGHAIAFFSQTTQKKRGRWHSGGGLTDVVPSGDKHRPLSSISYLSPFTYRHAHYLAVAPSAGWKQARCAFHYATRRGVRQYACATALGGGQEGKGVNMTIPTNLLDGLPSVLYYLPQHARLGIWLNSCVAHAGVSPLIPGASQQTLPLTALGSGGGREHAIAGYLSAWLGVVNTAACCYPLAASLAFLLPAHCLL